MYGVIGGGVKVRPNKNINNYKVKLIMRIRLIRRNKEKVLSILWERGSCKIVEKRQRLETLARLGLIEEL